MALRNQLQYPTNIASGNNDYFMVGIFNYQPPQSSGFGGGRGLFDIRGSQATRNLRNGIANIILPMPDNITDQNSVTWDQDSLNSLQLAGFQAAENAVDSVDTKKSPEENLKSLTSSVKGSFNDALSALKDPKLADSVKKALVGEAVNVFGGNMSANSILARTNGQVLNPNLELLFKGVILREFNYTFTLTPRDANESLQIKQIINLLKRSMAAKSTASSGAGAGAFIQSPDVFQPKFMQGPGAHPFLYSIRQSALVGMNVNYVGTGAYATYSDGTPVKMEMQLRFRELSPVYNEDYNDVRDGVGF